MFLGFLRSFFFFECFSFSLKASFLFLKGNSFVFFSNGLCFFSSKGFVFQMVLTQQMVLKVFFSKKKINVSFFFEKKNKRFSANLFREEYVFFFLQKMVLFGQKCFVYFFRFFFF